MSFRRTMLTMAISAALVSSGTACSSSKANGDSPGAHAGAEENGSSGSGKQQWRERVPEAAAAVLEPGVEPAAAAHR